MLLSRRLHKFHLKIDQLTTTIDFCRSRSVAREIQTPTIEKSLINLQVEWDLFVRGIILDSATGKFSDRNGPIRSNKASRPISRESASHLLISLYPKRTYEPDWYLPSDAADAAVRLQLSNANHLTAELGLTPWPISDLRFIRNYVSHRSKRSALDVRMKSSLASSRLDVIDFATQYTHTGTVRYIEWAAFIKSAATRLAN